VASSIIRLLLEWDYKQHMRDPGVFGAVRLEQLPLFFDKAREVLAAEPTLLEVRTPARVFGDIHGQLDDLLRLFKAYGWPDRTGDVNIVDYVFNGDFVDRGTNNCEVALLLLSLKITYPRRIFLLRGNHECRPINMHLGFLVRATLHTLLMSGNCLRPGPRQVTWRRGALRSPSWRMMRADLRVLCAYLRHVAERVRAPAGGARRACVVGDVQRGFRPPAPRRQD
jgi:hypothetical protein